MASFELNFNSPEKTVTISLQDEKGIFQLADLFKKLLDEAGIENTLTEKYTEPVEATSEEVLETWNSHDAEDAATE
jgi:hypothetical protein